MIGAQLQPRRLGGGQESVGLGILAHQFGPQLRTRRKGSGCASLLSKHESFFLFGQTNVDPAKDGQVIATVEGLEAHDGVLAVDHDVAPVPIADLGRIDDDAIELSHHLLDFAHLQLALVLGGDLQEGAVDGNFFIGIRVESHRVRSSTSFR